MVVSLTGCAKANQKVCGPYNEEQVSWCCMHWQLDGSLTKKNREKWLMPGDLKALGHMAYENYPQFKNQPESLKEVEIPCLLQHRDICTLAKKKRIERKKERKIWRWDSLGQGEKNLWWNRFFCVLHFQQHEATEHKIITVCSCP